MFEKLVCRLRRVMRTPAQPQASASSQAADKGVVFITDDVATRPAGVVVVDVPLTLEEIRAKRIAALDRCGCSLTLPRHGRHRMQARDNEGVTRRVLAGVTPVNGLVLHGTDRHTRDV